MSRHAVVSQLIQARSVAILRGVDLEFIRPTVEALLAGGITTLEITLNSPNALESLRVAASLVEGRALVGAGTVLDEQSAVAAILAGARFLVTPTTRPAVIRAGNTHGVPVLPGAMTPTEIETALTAGADIVKVFPASALGSRYFREVKAPLDHALLMATGGISAANAAEFLAAGADLLGIGSSLVDLSLVRQKAWSELEERARAIVAATHYRSEA